MAPKKTPKAPGGAADKDGAQEEPLAAVILADTFSRAFAPLDVSPASSSSAESVESCALLRPFLNVPLLSLHLRALSLARVEQVYILSIAHADVLREHLVAHPAPPGMEVTTVRTPEARSVGDSLREIDARQVIRGEFLLVQPDAIVGMDLAAIVEAHRARKLKDKDTAMTLCAMQVGENARSRPPSAPLHVLNGRSQLLHYAAHGVGKAIEIPNEVLFLEEKEGGDGELEVRADLVEAGIDVCGAEVPPLFSENFDYQSLRGDFVPGILTSDLLDSKIFMHVCSSPDASAGPSVQKNGYGARVSSTRAYDAITRDVLAGAAHPLIPSSNIWPGERLEKRGRALVGADVVLDDTSVLGPGTLVAGGSTLAADVRVARSVIGPGVSIGAHTAVAGSHVWQSVKIGARCSLDRSIIASGATLLDGVVLGRGCLIGPGCVVGPNVTLPPFSRVGAREHGDDDDDEWSGDAAAPKAPASVDPSLGSGGKGFLWPRAGDGRAPDDDDDDDDEDELDARLCDCLGAEAGDLSDDASEDASSIGGDSELLGDGSDVSSMGDAEMHEGAVGASLTLGGDGADGDETAADRAEANARLAEFQKEAIASLKRAFEEGHTTDNAAIELKTLRMASNVPLSEVRQVTISFILDRCDAKDGKQTAKTLDRWGPLIETVASDDEIEAVAMMQTYCALHASHAALFVPLLKKLYNDDLVSDEAIVAWWRSPAARDGSEARGGEAALELRRRAEPIVRFILESAEESEEESEEEE